MLADLIGRIPTPPAMLAMMVRGNDYYHPATSRHFGHLCSRLRVRQEGKQWQRPPRSPPSRRTSRAVSCATTSSRSRRGGATADGRSTSSSLGAGRSAARSPSTSGSARSRPAEVCGCSSSRPGLYTLPEHVQNTGILGLADPGAPFSLNENAPQPEPPRNEVWGIPWKSPIPFKGLAYTVGGRSLYWGGWSPRLLDEEMATWPASDRRGSQRRLLRRELAPDRRRRDERLHLRRAAQRAAPAAVRQSSARSSDVMPLPSLPPSPLLKPGADPLELLGLLAPDGLSPPISSTCSSSRRRSPCRRARRTPASSRSTSSARSR